MTKCLARYLKLNGTYNIYSGEMVDMNETKADLPGLYERSLTG
jgi:hypothetical protein